MDKYRTYKRSLQHNQFYEVPEAYLVKCTLEQLNAYGRKAVAILDDFSFRKVQFMKANHVPTQLT